MEEFQENDDELDRITKEIVKELEKAKDNALKIKDRIDDQHKELKELNTDAERIVSNLSL